MARLLGIAPLTHLELTPPEMVANAAQAGYDFLGLRLIPATRTEKHHFSLAEPSMMRETLQRLQDTPLKVLDIEIFRLQPGTDVTTYEAALAAGAMLGAKHALAAPQDTDPTRLADLLARFCELASQYGLGVDLEPTPWYEVRTLGECQQVIALTGRLDIGIVLDMIHFDRAGETAQAIQALPASYFRYAQLCDAPKLRPIDTEGLLFQARCERLMPGDGGLDLVNILQSLPMDLPLSLEVPMQALSATCSVQERSRQMRVKATALLNLLPFSISNHTQGDS